jgi:uncharacterized RDD family membrane protein YckC
MDDKLKYLIKRCLSAGIDLMIFGIIGKLSEPITQYKNADGQYYTHSGIVILMYYSLFLFQDIFFRKTLGKYLFKLEIKSLDRFELKKTERIFRLIIRRTFDLLDLICPIFYLVFIAVNKKNQKFGDYISKMIVVSK